MTVLDLLNEALTEIGVIGQDETAANTDIQFALGKLNRLLDNWNAERAAVYAQQFVRYTLTPALSPHTIGPSGTFVVTQRPVTIDGANLVYNTTTPVVTQPITLRTEQWWRQQPTKALSSSIPTDLYYQPDWPNGSLYFWPVPSTAYQVELETRGLLAQVDITTTFTLPPGYRDAITLTLAEDCAPAFGAEVSGEIAVKAARARGRVFNNNDTSRRLSTRDAGIPGTRPGSGFNYLTRTFGGR